MKKYENYINMCEKAQEVQVLWKPKFGDYYAEPDSHAASDYYMVVKEVDDSKLPNQYKHELVWLPTQPQLQRILYRKTSTAWYSLLAQFSEENKLVTETIEEIGIMYVMQQKYNKYWDGDNWYGIRNKIYVGEQ